MLVLNKYWLLALALLAVFFGPSAWAQQADEGPPPGAEERLGPSVPGESYMDRERRKELLAPYKPGHIPGQPDYGDTLGSEIPRPGSAFERTKPTPLPSPMDPLERRKKRYGIETERNLPEAPSPKATGPDLATTQLSREGVYRVSYAGDKPNSYGVPFNWQLRVTDSNGLPIRGANLSLRFSMPSSGHAPVITGMAVQELGGGLYKISGIRLDRAGLWHAALEVHGRGYGDIVTFNLMVR